MHSIKKTLGKVSLSDHLFIRHGSEEPCGAGWEQLDSLAFTLGGLLILESKSTFSFEIFCPLLSEETFSDSWKHAFGLPVSLPDCQLREEKHNVSVNSLTSGPRKCLAYSKGLKICLLSE